MNTKNELSAAFPPEQVKYKPGKISRDRAMVLFYIDARAVIDRLNEVLGIGGWSDAYALENNAAICTLSCLIDGTWTSKCDAAPLHGTDIKAALSNALKRAAVKFGVGRYLYAEAVQWCRYDPKNSEFVDAPKPAGWAYLDDPINALKTLDKGLRLLHCNFNDSSHRNALAKDLLEIGIEIDIAEAISIFSLSRPTTLVLIDGLRALYSARKTVARS